MNLSTVAAVQAYTATAGNNQVLAALVGAASSSVLRFLNQNLFQANYDESYTGTGTRRLVLRQGPVTAVTSVTIDGQPINLSSMAGQYGYQSDTLGLFLIGRVWPEGPNRIQVSYTAGYAPVAVTDSPVAIPSGLVLASQNPYWQSDSGVTYFSSGNPLTKVITAPAAGQYFVDAFGNYTFASGDLGTQVVLAYDVLGIPADISQAVNEIVGLNFTRRTKLNVKSKTIDAQTEAYITDDWPPSAMQTLTAWARTFPQL